MRLESFISETRWSCNKCGKQFTIKGHWYNQIGLETYCDIIHCWHKLKNHRKVMTKYDWEYMIKSHIILIPILILELLNIICIPFRLL